MEVQFNHRDVTKPWANARVELFNPLSVPISKLRAPLAALKWKMKDLEDLTRKAYMAGMEEKLAAERAKSHPDETPEPLRFELAGEEDLLMSQLNLYSSLVRGGFDVRWDEVGEIAPDEWDVVPVQAHAADEVEESPDPQPAPTDSAPADGA